MGATIDQALVRPPRRQNAWPASHNSCFRTTAIRAVCLPASRSLTRPHDPTIGPPLPASPHPPPPPCQGATNFALFSSNAWAVSLCLFSEADLREGRITHEVELDPGAWRAADGRAAGTCRRRRRRCQLMRCLARAVGTAAGAVRRATAATADLNRTGDVWHIALPSLDASLLYGYRLDGPRQVEGEEGEEGAAYGQAFDPVRGGV